MRRKGNFGSAGPDIQLGEEDVISAVFKTPFYGVNHCHFQLVVAKKPELAGFIIALPIASLIALALGHLQHGNSEVSIVFARSILIGVPVSYLFFVPFFLPSASKYGFWSLYVTGVALLGCGYLIHRQIVGWLS